MRPNSALTLLPISSVICGLSLRNLRTFSRPWPSWSPSYVNHEPDFLTTLHCNAMSRTDPSLEMPSPYSTSNSADLNGGAILFLTTLTLVRLPTASSPFLMVWMRRISRRTDA